MEMADLLRQQLLCVRFWCIETRVYSEPQRSMEALKKHFDLLASRVHHGDGDFEEAVFVDSANVVLADYTLLRKDFPHLASASDATIDAWILSQCASMTIGTS